MWSPLHTAGRSVLLVDDSDEHRLLTERALRHVHPETRCVSVGDGDAAMRHLDRRDAPSQRPELVLLDWRMPGRSGAEVLAWARAQPHLAGLPILVVSGVAFPEDRRLAEELGADGYLLKPSQLGGYAALARQVAEWRGKPPGGKAAPAGAPARESRGDCPSHWERGARMLRAMFGNWAKPVVPARVPRSARLRIERSNDQLTRDLVRLCRAQGIAPEQILQTLPKHESSSPLALQRQRVIRGLARRGWDTHELAELFPLSPAAIRLLVRRRA